MNSVKLYLVLIHILLACVSFGQPTQWKGITKIINDNPSRLSTDSSTNAMLISNGPTMIENKNYYGCATWDGSKFDSLAPYSTNYNILQIIRFNGSFYANTPTQILKKISVYTWSIIATVKNSATSGMCIYKNNLIVYGGFDSINNVQASHIAKFDGTNWSRMDTMHFKSGTHILTAEEFNGNLYFGGTVVAKNGWCYNLGMFDGNKFLNVDNNAMAGSNSAVVKIKKYKGALYIIGNFTTYNGNPGNNIIKWDGFAWDTLGGGITIGPNIIYDFTEHNNELYFVGMFYSVAGMNSPGFFKFDGNNFWGHTSCTDYQILKCIHSYKDTLYVSGFMQKICSDSAKYIAKWIDNGSIFTNSVNVIGINELKQENNLVIFPNPVTDLLKIMIKRHIDSNSSIEIINALGQTVLELNYSTEIDVSTLSQGYYTLKITTPDKHQFHSKFLKE